MTASRSERFALRVAPIALALAVGCAGSGGRVLGSGRGMYNDVINRTEDEQILAMIVRQRYDETYGLLAVSSVTASIRLGATVGANVGIGSENGYAGNLVPLSAGVMYEDNPTISYVPVRGEQFVQRMLAPISAEQTLLLGRLSTDQMEAMRLLVRRANTLANPLYAASASGPAFDRFVDLFAHLRDQGVLDVVQADDARYEVLCHDYSAEQRADVDELIRLLGIPRQQGEERELSLPLRFFVGGARSGGLDLETPSAIEVVEAAGLGVDVPDVHLSEGVARAMALAEPYRFLAIHSSSSRPAEAVVAVTHRGWWFYIDARDARSKQTFMMLRTLIGLRLDDSDTRQAPVLTVPVGG